MSKGATHSDTIPVSPSLPADNSQAPFTPHELVNKRVFLLGLQSVINAVVIGFIARGLVGLIDLITNIAFYGRFSFLPVEPHGHNLGLLVILIPVIGGIVVGLMARFGSAAIRGHGIPEAMEQILLNESKIKPAITFLKPLSAAIAIGTGGPFGAEGPIIATGGAFGSVAGQVMRVTANERKILLAAGACAGMSAIFGTPLAAVLLAIELLLFEFSPRSIIVVALACVTGAAMHFIFFGTDPVFAMPAIPEPGTIAMVMYVLMGAAVGIFASLVSKSVYAVEDLFEKLPIHWMWWPAIGAVVVGVVGYFAPQTLGVGYNNITTVLQGSASLQLLLVLCVLKYISWVFSLGSGTSGGTLAPLLTIGGALGGLLGVFVLWLYPGSGINTSTAVLIGMAAMFAGASRALLTSIVFALETTMQPHGLLPLLGACTAAYFISFFMMKGSIMTEKIERRGVKTPNSYAPEILQTITVEQVVNTDTNVLYQDNTIKEAREWIKDAAEKQGQVTAFIIVDDQFVLKGVLKRETIFDKSIPDNTSLLQVIPQTIPHIYRENRLSIAVDIMDKYDLDVLPVIDHHDRKVQGTISHKDIFKAYSFRRNDETLLKQALSLKREGLRMISKGQKIWRRY